MPWQKGEKVRKRISDTMDVTHWLSLCIYQLNSFPPFCVSRVICVQADPQRHRYWETYSKRWRVCFGLFSPFFLFSQNQKQEQNKVEEGALHTQKVSPDLPIKSLSPGGEVAHRATIHLVSLCQRVLSQSPPLALGWTRSSTRNLMLGNFTLRTSAQR